VSLKAVLIFQKELLKIIEEHTVKHCALRMTLAIDPAHGRDSDSRNTPRRRDVYFALLADKYNLRLKQEVVNGCLLTKDKTQTCFYWKIIRKEHTQPELLPQILDSAIR